MSRIKTLVVLLFIFLLLPVPKTAAQVDWPEIIERTKQSVVTVYSYNSTEVENGRVQTVQGSGFFIAQGVIITNYHVLESFYSGTHDVAYITLVDEKNYLVSKVLSVDIENDLAMAEVDVPYYVKPLSLNISLPRIGEEIRVISSPKGLKWTATGGIVSSVRDGIWIETNEIQIDAAISPGSSGGPVMNTKGEVIGVAYSMLVGEGVESLNFAIPAERVYRLAGALYGMKDSDGDFVADKYDSYDNGNGGICVTIVYYDGDGSPDGWGGARGELDPYFEILLDVNGDGDYENTAESEVFDETDRIEGLCATFDIPDNVEDVTVVVKVWDFDAMGLPEPIDIVGRDPKYKFPGISYDLQLDGVKIYEDDGARDNVDDEIDAKIKIKIEIVGME